MLEKSQNTAKKVYVSTFCVMTSYGSILQSFALKKVLEKIGVTSVILNEKSDNNINSYKFYRKGFGIKDLIYNLDRFLNKKQISERFKKNLAFIDKNMDIETVESYSDLKTKDFDTDIFLAGSDQIFHPDVCNPLFFLDFAPLNSKKISYAASMGSLDIRDEKKQEFVRLINNFDYISLRENDSEELVSSLTDKEVTVNCDPTFLFTADEWRSIEKPCNIKGKYILVFPIYWHKSLNKELESLHKRTGLPIVLISDNFWIYHQKIIKNAGVDEFLWLIDNAEYVVTSSFHGAALSLNFNKKVSMVINNKAPSRLNSLSKLFDYPIIPIGDIDRFEGFDFDKVNKIKEAETQRSLLYLKRTIFDE